LLAEALAGQGVAGVGFAQLGYHRDVACVNGLQRNLRRATHGHQAAHALFVTARHVLQRVVTLNRPAEQPEVRQRAVLVGVAVENIGNRRPLV